MTFLKIRINSNRGHRKRLLQPRLATLFVLGTFSFFSTILGAWFLGIGAVSKFFQTLELIQQNPPLWLEVPMSRGEYLLAPTIVLFLIVNVIMKLSPQPKNWSRVLIVGILLGLTIRYLLWRLLSTLNLSDPLNGSFSLGLLFLEMLMLTSSTLQLILMLKSKNRSHQADILSKSVIEGDFSPSVDIFIPTYEEPIFILKRTIIGCQAMEYNHKQIYVLDDTNRCEVKQLAQELGCQYLTRSDNLYAKAGNLNNAIAQTKGELIAVFDADFVPTKNFLTRTVGFFQNNKIALVQTPQSFYNIDPIARNLGLENILTPEEEVFYRQIQPMRDGAGSVICAGTSFVVKRNALEEVSGFVTDSLSEDYFTGIRLTAIGYRLVYLDEKLSAGLAAENISAQATQRLRWARGTLQAFFIKSNPLTIPGLRLIQRLAHLEGLLYWFTSISRMGFLIVPLAYAFLGVIPIRASFTQFIYFFLPYYLIQLTVFSWLNYRSRSAILSDIYTLALTFPLALTVIKVMLNPFSKGFKVTPKGTISNRFNFNWKLAFPLIFFFITTLLSLWQNLEFYLFKENWMITANAIQFKGFSLGLIWSFHNLFMIVISLLILLDVPKPNLYEWFDLQRQIRIKIANKTFQGVTTSISEIGANIALTQSDINLMGLGDIPVELEILDEAISLQGQLTSCQLNGEFITVRVIFEQLTLDQERSLVEMLYCRPGQWKRQNAPGELQSLWLLFKILCKPSFLFKRNPKITTVSVSQV